MALVKPQFKSAAEFSTSTGVPVGTAIPQVIARHSHPKARPETPEKVSAPATGIDYTALIAAEHQAHLAAAHLSYADLAAGGAGHGHDGEAGA